MKWRIERRTFLRGAAGATLPLPFLNLMENTSAASEDNTPPLRFVTLFKPNGVHPPSWNINGGSEFDFRFSPLMQPFAKHKSDLLILDNMGDFGFSSHANSTRRFLSGHHENTRGPSIDQLIAKRICGNTPFPSLELTTEGLFTNQIGCSYISYDSNGNPIPRESDPQLVFDRLFRSPMSDPARRQATTSLLDRVSEDARSLASKAGVEDRDTLDQYLTVVRETERRVQNLNSAVPRMDYSRLQRPQRAGNLNDQVDAMLDLIALSLWTDSTRCVTYMLGNSNSRMIFDFLGIVEQHHYLSHFFRNFSRHNLEALLKISLWHMEKFDYLLTRLKSYKDHTGSLLENCVVLFGSGMGHSDNHTATRIPTILAGQGGGMLKTGRYVRYATNQHLSRLHLSLLHKFGVDTRSYAETSEPLPGLDGSGFESYREPAFESWLRVEGGTIEVQGRLRMSDDLNEARIFYVDVEGHAPVRIDVEFRDFHQFNIAYHCGTAVCLSGEATELGAKKYVINKVIALRSLFGTEPGSAPG